MKRIGILSDTHSYWDDKYLHYFEPCDEIWHAGDIGSVEVAEKLAAFRPFRAVCGNCDGVAILATMMPASALRSLPIRHSCSWLGIHIF